MCQKESWEAIFATTEAHSTQKDQPPRMHGPGLWMYEQKEQRVTPVPMIGVNCNLECPGWDGKDFGGRSEQDPSYELTRTSPLAISPQLFHSKLKTLLSNPILIHRHPHASLPVSTPNTIHHSRLTVCLPDSLGLDRCLSILFWLSACE